MQAKTNFEKFFTFEEEDDEPSTRDWLYNQAGSKMDEKGPKKTQIKPNQRRQLIDLLQYSIDILAKTQERLVIEDPVGPDQGFWTVFEVFKQIRLAITYEKERFGELGRTVTGWMNRFFKPTFRSKLDA